MSSAIDELDPVCGREIDRHEAVAEIRYGAFTYYFDTEDCAARFRREPERFVGNSASGQGAT
ncbi:MAG TPA: YHS domain-containing protein [Candidatus Dormibacteraeota bacterium]|jgi:YHS domain-containing protein